MSVQFRPRRWVQQANVLWTEIYFAHLPQYFDGILVPASRASAYQVMAMETEIYITNHECTLLVNALAQSCGVCTRHWTSRFQHVFST